MKKLKVEKSKFPEDNKTHLVVQYSESQNGYGIGRIFKGTYKECVSYKKRLENERH